MRTKYHCSRSLLAGFLAVVMLASLVPAASAAQQNSYHDPAEHWQEANNRTNELDANAVKKDDYNVSNEVSKWFHNV